MTVWGKMCLIVMKENNVCIYICVLLYIMESEVRVL